MSKVFVLFVFLGLLLSICEGQFEIGVSRKCPKCTDPYDPDTCTGSLNCYNTEDVCEMTVDTGDKNKVNYFCIHAHACSNHAARTCDPSSKSVCSFCCKKQDDCNKLRDTLFSSTFSKPTTNPATVAMASTAAGAATNSTTP